MCNSLARLVCLTGRLLGKPPETGVQFFPTINRGSPVCLESTYTHVRAWAMAYTRVFAELMVTRLRPLRT